MADSKGELRAALTRDGEARVRRNVAALLAADWGEDPDTEYHPDEMCQSDRDLIHLLATLDRDRAALAAPPTSEPSGLPFTEEALHDELRDVLLAHGIRPFNKALAHDLYANLLGLVGYASDLRAAPSTPEPSADKLDLDAAWETGYREGVERGPIAQIERLRVIRNHHDPSEIGWNAAIAAVVDLLRAAPSTEPALDVERLARAIHGSNEHPNLDGCLDMDRDTARLIAAEYDRLAESQP